MKYIYFLFFFFSIICCNTDIKIERQKKYKNHLTWKDTSIDLGIINSKSKSEFVFVATNKSTDTIKLEKIEAECGCTDVNTKPQNILPMDSIIISGFFNPDGYSGKVEKSIFIVANTEELFYRLKIIANVTEP